MKTIYKCDVCGKEFTDSWEDCHNHEKTCAETHATGLRLAREINNAIATAKENGKTKIAVSGEDIAFQLDHVYYSASKMAVVLELNESGSFRVERKEDMTNE